MWQKHRSQVIISGAGPVGLFAAAELTRRNISVYLVDRDWRGGGYSYALALHPQSLEMLDDLGLSQSLLDNGRKITTLAFYEGITPRLNLDLTRVEGTYPFLTVIPQNWMESVLEDWLQRHKVKVQWNHCLKQIDDNTLPVTATIERWGIDYTGYSVPRKIRVVEKQIQHRTDFVIGADGHGSKVRDHIGAIFEESGTPELFAVFEFETDADLEETASIVIDDTSTSVLWPLPGGRCRWSFQLPDLNAFDGERIKSRLPEIGHWVTPGLTQERLESLISERAPWFPGTVKELIWSVPVRFERRLASMFGSKVCWLAGDSAHLAGPLGIHSMNVGLREARDLAHLLEAVLREQAPSSALDDYALERRMEWARLMNLRGSLQATDAASPFVRKNAERILSCLPASGTNLDILLDQIGLRMDELVRV